MGVLMKTHHFSTALSTSLGKPNRFPSPAKLNLFLYINGKLPNGYHELQTLFQFLDFGDWLTIDIRQDKQIHITPEIPDQTGVCPEVTIRESIRLPGEGSRCSSYYI